MKGVGFEEGTDPKDFGKEKFAPCDVVATVFVACTGVVLGLFLATLYVWRICG